MDSWRVGVLFSQSGVTSLVESTQFNATMLAIDEINAIGGVSGRLIEQVAYDPGSIPRNYGALAERLCSKDKVSIIFGCHMSSTRKATLPVVEKYRALLFYPTLYEGFEYSRNCIYTGAAPNQNSVQLVKYLNHEYGNRIFIVGSNYVYPYESNRIVTDLFRQIGGKIVEECYVPLDITERGFESIITKIKKSKPNAIYSTVVGDGIPHFYHAFSKAGLDSTVMPIASQSTTEAEISKMKPGTATGHITAAPYFSTLDTPRNQKFIAAYKARFGSDMAVGHCAEAAYFQVYLFAAALERAGSDDLDILLPHLYDVEYDAPQGRVKISEANNHTFLWSRVGRVNASGKFDLVYDPNIRVEPDPYMVKIYPNDVLYTELL